ncbi:MAG: response regulator [Sulfurimonas sp.]|nr:response regulator [Sulfurimonas sp.]
MIQEYLYEMIALIVLLTSIVIYFLTVKFQQEEMQASFNETNTIKVQDKTEILKQDSTTKENLVETEDEPYILSGEEEGSFGNIPHNPFNKKEVQARVKKTHRQKIDVPKHGKITKKHFSEFNGVKILVAEDNVINQKVIRGLLEGSGIEVTMADDGQIALDILEQNDDFNLVLMDAHMPRVDGFEATRRIRANPKYEHIVIVALSGDTAVDDIKKMRKAGMAEHLEKPLRMNDFYDILYAYTKEVTETGDFVEVIMTKELNGDQGLSVCGGEDEFYKDILHDFLQNYASSSKELTDLLQKDDLAGADEMLLDFIGITANIGADNIRLIALELKEAIKDTQEKSYSIILEEYKQHLEILLYDIREYIK